MNSDEIKTFYDSPLEPERKRRLAIYLNLVTVLDGEHPDDAVLERFKAAKASLESINDAMRAEYQFIKSEQLRTAQRVEELRRQQEQDV